MTIWRTHRTADALVAALSEEFSTRLAGKTTQKAPANGFETARPSVCDAALFSHVRLHVS